MHSTAQDCQWPASVMSEPSPAWTSGVATDSAFLSVGFRCKRNQRSIQGRLTVAIASRTRATRRRLWRGAGLRAATLRA
jgi:hypothetical protein